MIIGHEWSFKSNLSYDKLSSILEKAEKDGIDNMKMIYSTLRLIE